MQRIHVHLPLPSFPTLLPFQDYLLPRGHVFAQLCQMLLAVWALKRQRKVPPWPTSTSSKWMVTLYTELFLPYTISHTHMLSRCNKLWMQVAFSFYKWESTKALNSLNKDTWLGKNRNWNISSGLSGSALHILLCCFKMAAGRSLGQSSVKWHTIHFDGFFSWLLIF